MIGMERTTEKFRIATGVLTPLAALGTFVGSAALSTSYTWPNEPFSVIGGEANLLALLFNAGLVTTGLLSIPFATLLWTENSKSEGVLFSIIGFMFIGAGVFPMKGDPSSGEFLMGGGSTAHAIFGSGIFIGISLYLLLAGAKRLRSEGSRAGLTAVGLGLITILVWLPWDFGLLWAWVGWGAAELVVVACFGLWSISTAGRLWKRETNSPASGRVEGQTGI